MYKNMRFSNKIIDFSPFLFYLVFLFFSNQYFCYE